MYTCGKCGATTQTHEKMKRLVTKTRNVEYPERQYKHKRKGETVYDPGGVGHETVAESAICEKCAPEG